MRTKNMPGKATLPAALALGLLLCAYQAQAVAITMPVCGKVKVTKLSSDAGCTGNVAIQSPYYQTIFTNYVAAAVGVSQISNYSVDSGVDVVLLLDVWQCGFTYLSTEALHARITALNGPPATSWKVEWEDGSPGCGDCDYNDIVIQVDVVSECVPPPPTPTVSMTPTAYPVGCGTPVFETGSRITNGQCGNSLATRSFPFTVPSTTYGLLLVAVGRDTYNPNAAITSITYDNQPLTPSYTDPGFNSGDLKLYYLVSPHAGNLNLDVNFAVASDNSQWVVAAEVFSGVNQSAPLGQHSYSTNTNNSFITSITTTGAASMAVDFLYNGQNNFPTSVGPFQTPIPAITGGGNVFIYSDCMNVNGPGNHIMKYTWTSSTQTLRSQLVEINGAAACGTPLPTATPSLVITPTLTASPTMAFTPTLTATRTSTFSPQPTPTLSPALTATGTGTPSPVLSPTASPTRSPVFTATWTRTMTRTYSETRTQAPAVEFRIFVYPNAIGPDGATLALSLPYTGDLELRVYNVAGEIVRKFGKEYVHERYPRYFWDAKNDAGNGVSYGLYLVRAELVQGDARMAASKWVAVDR